jgi:hypothetical protein
MQTVARECSAQDLGRCRHIARSHREFDCLTRLMSFFSMLTGSSGFHAKHLACVLHTSHPLPQNSFLLSINQRCLPPSPRCLQANEHGVLQRPGGHQLRVHDRRRCVFPKPQTLGPKSLPPTNQPPTPKHHLRAKREQLESFDNFSLKVNARIWP